MSLHLVHPLALALAIPVLAGAVLLWRRAPGGGARLVAALRPLSMLLLVAALAQPQLRHDDARPTVLVVDRSASVDAGMLTREAQWVAQARRSTCPAPCRVVRFAGIPALGAPASRQPALRPGTDMATALRLAIARVPPGGRVVVLGDGQQTTGDVLAQAAVARTRGTAIDVVPLAPTRRDAAVTRVRGPQTLHSGDELDLQVTVRSSTAGSALVALARDGRSAGRQRLAIHAGDTLIPLTVRAPSPGWHSYAVRVTQAGDTVRANDVLTTTVRVVARPRVLLVSTAASPLRGLLSRRGLQVQTAAPGALPTSALAFAGYDAVVLDDVDSRRLGPARARALTTAVRDDGVGLVVSGGPHSYSLGHYAHSTLERVLPVSSLVPGNLQRRNVALELVIDKSGSMIDLAGETPKIDQAQAAARTAVSFASRHQDELGIVAFDVVPHTLVPRARVTPQDVARIDRRIATLNPNGGTNAYSALQLGARQLEASKLATRHMILVSDGLSGRDEYAALGARLKREHISVSSVVIGARSDEQLEQLATITGGRFYSIADASDLPRIFARETRLASRPVQVNGRVAVSVATSSPLVRSLVGERLAPLGGNVVTVSKDRAQTVLTGRGRGGRQDPVLARWQYGAGRVASWTPGSDASGWARTWATDAAFWDDLVRDTGRPPVLPALTPTVPADAPTRIQIDAYDNTGAPLDLAHVTGSVATGAGSATRALRFVQIAPSRYSAAVPGLAPGAHRYRVSAGSGPAASGMLAVPYSGETLLRPASASPLGELAARTGGRVLDAGDPGVLAARTTALWWWLALAALLVFLTGTALRLLGVPRPRETRASGADEPRAPRRAEEHVQR